MSQIIDSLLTLSQVARKEIQHEELDLSDIASTVAVELSKKNPKNHVEVIIEKGGKARGMQGCFGLSWKIS